jgi:glycosyltransferase involved in cell wall biosynthesis
MDRENLLKSLNSATISDWNDISTFIDHLAKQSPPVSSLTEDEFYKPLKSGMAFITYDYGIDGVTIEVAKYAECLEKILADDSGDPVQIHMIGGEFLDKADVILEPRWKRFVIEDMNGWDKWSGGKYFSKLYYEDMPDGSDISKEMAVTIWQQAVEFADKLASYLEENKISLLIPVNIPSNPGNFPIMLALVIVTEAFNTNVISSNHDYYWEGGKPASQKSADEEPGVRDHFFHNCKNLSFFGLFKRIYPWNGKRWLQVSINTRQSETLVQEFGFQPEKTFELGTFISDDFFMDALPGYTYSVRERMNYIISDGYSRIRPIPIKDHLNDLGNWMQHQVPVAVGCRTGLTLDLRKSTTIYCLQPTRVVARKRIEMDFEMLQALMHYEPFNKEFAAYPAYQLVLHITGPTPIEHQDDLESVLNAYLKLSESLPEELAERIFLVFSVGNEYHRSFEEHGLERMHIEDIYHLATAILFPSETEGRGLPILESSAGGIPIICSRYYPEEVFAEVVGEHLPDTDQVKYLLFPENGYDDKFLAEVMDMLLCPDKLREWKEHNKNAVKKRYSSASIRHKFKEFFNRLQDMPQG